MEEELRSMSEQASRKPMKYYVDFENVHGPGLKGVDSLGEDDHVLVFYSQAAETFHIEHAIDLLHSKAKIEFIEIDGGTRNSLDFQLVAALFGTISDEFGYAIVSGDGGFDAAIKMGQRLELPEVVRIVNILGDTELPAKTRTRRSRSTKAAKEQPATPEQEPEQQHASDVSEEEAQDQAKPTRRPRRRGGARRSSAAKAEQAAESQAAEQGAEAQVAEQGEHQTEVHAAGEIAPAGEPRFDATPDETSQKPQAEVATGQAAKDSATETVKESAGQAAKEPTKEAGPNQAKLLQKLPAGKPQPQLPASSGHEEVHAEAKPSNGSGNGRRRGSRGSGKSGKREDVEALLASHGIEVSQQQLSTIMQALNGAKKRQDFYRRIIQIEKQEKGLALYRQVRDYYEPLLEIVKA